MSARLAHDLKPLIDKLSRQSALGGSEVAALQGLPYEIVELPRSSYIIREGDKPGYCAAVLSGFVYRSKLTGDGARQILSVHLQGDLVCGHDQLLGGGRS